MPPRGSEGEARLLKFMEGVKAAGATQLWSGDWEPNTIATDEPSFAPFMDLNAVYTYGLKGKSGATYVESRNAFSYSPPRPAYLKETRYENEHGPDGNLLPFATFNIVPFSAAVQREPFSATATSGNSPPTNGGPVLTSATHPGKKP